MRYLKLTFAALFVLGVSQAHAQNLVMNPGFETGDFTGYTVNAGSTSVELSGGSGNYAPQEGNYYAALGTVSSDGTISQDIATTPGEQYLVSFFLASNGSTPNHFATLFDGNVLFDQINIPTQAYTQYSFLASASTATTTLLFRGRNDPNYLALDAISVTAVSTAVPEPGSIALLAGITLAGAGFLRRRKQAGKSI